MEKIIYSTKGPFSGAGKEGVCFITWQ